MWLPISFAIVFVSIIYMQKSHYEFLSKEIVRKQDKEFEDLRKKVDALALRAGFKL